MTTAADAGIPHDTANMGPKKKIKAKDLKISVINEKEFFDLL